MLTVSRLYTGTVHQFGSFMSEKLPNTALTKKGAERYRDVLWLYAKRCVSYAEHEAGKWTASWRGYVCLLRLWSALLRVAEQLTGRGQDQEALPLFAGVRFPCECPGK